MSESEYLRESGREFIGRHPASEGWRIFHVPAHMAGYLTTFLPAFLRRSAPRAIVREGIWTQIGFASGKGVLRTSLTENPYRRRGPGMTEMNWAGELDLIWNGVPVHYVRWPVAAGASLPTATWIATKDRAALENLYRELRRARGRLHSRRSAVVVFGMGPFPRPRYGWDEVILPGRMMEEIRQTIEAFLAAKRHYRVLGLPYRRGLLFAGPPGCGKTLATKVIASQVKAKVFVQPIRASLEDRDIGAAFGEAQESAPAVLVLEDLDKLAGCPKVSLSFVLNLLDGLCTPEGVLVIATTNEPEKLDLALLQRPSRFDQVWHFPLPGFEERLRLLERRAKGKFSAAALEAAARKCEGFTMAYVQEIVVNALLKGIFDKRESKDADLAWSLGRLRKQYKANMKAEGALRSVSAVGFSLPDANGGES